jgi:hypothetical protein
LGADFALCARLAADFARRVAKLGDPAGERQPLSSAPPHRAQVDARVVLCEMMVHAISVLMREAVRRDVVS